MLGFPITSGALGLDAVAARQWQALRDLDCEMEIDPAAVRGATRPFEEPGALKGVARLAARWFKGYLGA